MSQCNSTKLALSITSRIYSCAFGWTNTARDRIKKCLVPPNRARLSASSRRRCGALPTVWFKLKLLPGTYILKEDLHLASPPPHSSEALVLTSNPLATTPQPATAGTKISLLCYNSTNPTLQIGISESNKSARSVTYVENTADKSNDSKGSADKTSTKSEDERTSASGSIKQAPSTSSVLVFGESNSFLPIVAKDVGKKKKPKNNIARSNSSFISRCSIHENLAKRLQETRSNGYFAFANISRAFQWLELSSNQRVCNSSSASETISKVKPGRILNKDLIQQRSLPMS